METVSRQKFRERGIEPELSVLSLKETKDRVLILLVICMEYIYIEYLSYGVCYVLQKP